MTLGSRARSRAARTGRTVFEHLPASAREGIRRNRDLLRGLLQLKHNQATLARRLAQLERTVARPGAAPSEVADERFPPGIRSRLCTQAQLDEPWYARWCEVFGEPPRANRKLWEHAYIAHTLDSLDMLQAGRRGVGFGVGRERLVSLFAGLGCEIVATDLPAGAREARTWVAAGQHGALEDLLRPALCAPGQFQKLVSRNAVDMRSLPSDLVGFDFCWSACALEHLGSLEAGMRFVHDSLATLVPGGVAVHTTELNLSSADETVASGPTVLYRRRDLQTLSRQLEAAGHEVAALALEPGGGVLDEYVALPPFVAEPHLAVWFKGFATTSVALVIRAGGRP